MDEPILGRQKEGSNPEADTQLNQVDDPLNPPTYAELPEETDQPEDIETKKYMSLRSTTFYKGKRISDVNM